MTIKKELILNKHKNWNIQISFITFKFNKIVPLRASLFDIAIIKNVLEATSCSCIQSVHSMQEDVFICSRQLPLFGNLFQVAFNCVQKQGNAHVSIFRG